MNNFSSSELKRLRKERAAYNLQKDYSIFKFCNGSLKNMITKSKSLGVQTSSLELTKSIENFN